jgi:predicted nucleic acid-binding protein
VIVVDASAVLETLLRTRAAAAVEERLFDGRTLHAPHFGAPLLTRDGRLAAAAGHHATIELV